jgi:predicted AAA+ superfamily ATPase
MIIREHYMAQIRPFYESDLVKIITGIRRCGKSVIFIGEKLLSANSARSNRLSATPN